MPGHVGLGEHELELHPTEGHTADGMAIWAPWARRARLRRLPVARRDPDALGDAARATPTSRRSSGCARWSSEAEWVVPGHGAPIDGARALAILDEDVRYLTDWELPLTRRTAAQRAVDAENRQRAGEAP